MASAEVTLVYADSSALVKLVRSEPETPALRTYVEGADLVSSELVLTELPRAIRRAAAHEPASDPEALLEVAEELLEAVGLLPVERDLVLLAGRLTEPALRSLDAIHIAAALAASPLEAFVGYDERQAAAARLMGLRTIAPGGP